MPQAQLTTLTGFACTDVAAAIAAAQAGGQGELRGCGRPHGGACKAEIEAARRKLHQRQAPPVSPERKAFNDRLLRERSQMPAPPNPYERGLKELREAYKRPGGVS